MKTIRAGTYKLFSELTRREKGGFLSGPDHKIKSVSIQNPLWSQASEWIVFKDGSGCIKQYYREIGADIFIGSALVSLATFDTISTIWKTSYLFIVNENDKCVAAIKVSSKYNYPIDKVLREVEENVEHLTDDIYSYGDQNGY